jgi:uncharacterized alkaline shock family protein YloU
MKKGVDMNDNANQLGTIYVSHRAISTIAYQAALSSYGVVGLAAQNFAEGLTQMLVKDPTQGVEIQFEGQKLIINLYIIVEYGLRIQSVASSVADSVRYQVEKAMSMPVAQVNVHIRGLRISNPD